MRVCSICGAPAGTCSETMREIAQRQPTITRLPALREIEEMAKKVANRTYWFTADKQEVVEDGDERAAFLLVRKGSPVDPDVATEYGLDVSDYADVRTSLPGANIVAQNSARVEAHRRAAAAQRQAAEDVQDAGQGRQRAHAEEGKISRAIGAPASDEARRVMEHQEASLEGSDLLTGTQAAKEGGAGSLGEAYKDRTEEDAERADRLDAPKRAASAPPPNSRTREVQPPPGTNPPVGALATDLAPIGENLQPGTQEYTAGVGVAITPEGTERVDKTAPPESASVPPNPPAPVAGQQIPAAQSTTPAAEVRPAENISSVSPETRQS